MVNYDPTVVQNFADRLYREARDIVWSYISRRTVIGVAIGLVAGIAVRLALEFASTPLSTAGNDIPPVGFFALAGVCALIGGITGYFAGKERAFELRLKAQEILCKLQIEKNTRPAQVSTP